MTEVHYSAATPRNNVAIFACSTAYINDYASRIIYKQ